MCYPCAIQSSSWSRAVRGGKRGKRAARFRRLTAARQTAGPQREGAQFGFPTHGEDAALMWRPLDSRETHTHKWPALDTSAPVMTPVDSCWPVAARLQHFFERHTCELAVRCPLLDHLVLRLFDYFAARLFACSAFAVRRLASSLQSDSKWSVRQRSRARP